ncbi:MAG: carboxynorspermidine decarboxylase, partial [Butyricicoccaceae bacterium]
MFSVYPLIGSIWRAQQPPVCTRHRREEFGGETNNSRGSAEGSRDSEYADHIVFNCSAVGGLRQPCPCIREELRPAAHPECSTQPSDHAMYDPCGPDSRLGITIENFQPELLDGIEGFHFHTLCEQNSDDLVRTVAAFEQNFGQYMDGLKWINLGGGHHITRAD